MLFNSSEYLLVFLPVSLVVFFWLNSRRKTGGARLWLLAASFLFYAWWSRDYLWLLLISIALNFGAGVALTRLRTSNTRRARYLLTAAVIANFSALCYYKYAHFIVTNTEALVGADFGLSNVVLPLAISFFTFTQVAYLIDSYRGQVHEPNLLNYALFVMFFPHLIAGPILHHREMMPQFGQRRNAVLSAPILSLGLTLLSIGLFKKVIIADTFSIWATAGFDKLAAPNFFEAWTASLSYTFQLYFDFSGYTDIALGSALLFNIRLPINFNSPYKARNIRDFWRRWHMTLSRFLRDYLYVPLGGNRRGTARVIANLMITFVLGGLWHGASWMFVIWGALHGAAMIVHRAWSQLGIGLPRWLAWLITFNFVNLAWVFFRARDMADAKRVLEGMAGMHGAVLPPVFGDWLPQLKSLGISFGPILRQGNDDFQMMLWLVAAFVIVLAFRNSNQLAPYTGGARAIRPAWAVLCGLMASVSLVGILASKYSEFIYFNF